MEKWKWNSDNWRSDGFAATKLRNTVLCSWFEVKIYIFRRRILVFPVHISENFRLRQISINSWFFLQDFPKNHQKILYGIFKNHKKFVYEKNVDDILIRISYKNSYKHYFKFPDFKKKVCPLPDLRMGESRTEFSNLLVAH